MKNLYRNFNLTKFTILCLFTQFAVYSNLNSQPYSFTAASETFTPLSGGTALTSIQADDFLSTAINLGFNFKFNGKVYTQALISSNGFMTFRIVNPNVRFSYNDSSFIAPLGDDVSGLGGTASYKTEGTAPNRIFTMEWLNWKWRYQATAACISFQVKLYETSNRIEFIYRQESGTLNNPNAYIGLSFQTKDNYMLLSNSGSSPEVKTISPVSIKDKPATGQIYRFDPLIKPEPTNYVTNFLSVASGKLAIQWTDAIGTNLPSRYLIKVSNVSFAAITDPVDGAEVVEDLNLNDGTGAALVDFGKQKFNGWTDSIGNTILYMKIFPLSNLNTYCNYKTDGVVPQLQISIPAYESRNLSFTAFTSTSINLQWVRGSYSNCVVFVKENGTGKAIPVNNITYTANSKLGDGTQIDNTGWFCVYNGTANTVNVTGLKPATSYAFHVIEYSGAAGVQQYSTGESTSAYKVFTTNLFSEVATAFTGVGNSAATWVDYDNDNDIDFIIAGSTSTGIKTILYRNDAGTFVNSGVIFPDVKNSSVSWADYDNDGFADLLLMGLTSTVRVTKIFHNNGNGTFTELPETNMPGLELGNASWADYNNDGLTDFFVCGYDGTKFLSQIYRNAGSGIFYEQSNISIKGIRQATSAWADFDNDGFVDLAISGYTGGTECISKIYKNIRNGNFVEVTGLSLPAIANSSIDVGDYDSDGDQDILFTGNYYVSSHMSKIYKNDGNFVFTAQNQIALESVRNGSQHFGDFDSDGDLDIIINGLIDSNNGITKVYRNNGGEFEEINSIILPNVSLSSAALGDYDNDNDLDILITGQSSTGFITKIFKNESILKNTVPGIPSGLTSTIGEELMLQWNPVTADATPSTALSYNVRLGKSSGVGDVIAPLSSTTGLRRVVAPGNVQQGNTLGWKSLKKGTYFWSVQAIDNNFAGGPFAPEQTFVYNKDDQASHLNIQVKNSTSVKCQWDRGNGDKCAVFVKETGTDVMLPVNNTTYPGNKNFTSNTQIGTTGWYCVYNGDKDTATIYNLKSNTEYRFQVIEYTGAAGSEVYYTTTGDGNPAHYRPPFTEQTHVTLTGVSANTSAWGDYDNDGDLDIILGGNSGTSQVVELYTNNGNNTFTKSPATFVVNNVYDIQWGDYDNDNDLDLLILSTINSKVFENKGDGTFGAKANLADVFTGKGQWADFDNDGFKDIIFTGSGGTKIYKNNHDGTFTIQTHTLPTVSNYSAVACGDYDNDGDLDVLLSGMGDSEAITKVFKNEGNFTFIELAGTNFPGISNCTVEWADMDNDGDLDIVLAGADYDFATKIFDNAGNNSFTEITGTNFKELNRTSIAIGDYDNDGDRDLLVSGTWDDSDYYTILYQNTGNKTYAEVKTINFPGIQYGSSNWGDYDNDNDLDLFICGKTATGRISKIFRNNGSVFNTKPAVQPSTLYYTLNGNDVTFKWYKASDVQTLANGHSYNLYLYETSKPVFSLTGDVIPFGKELSGRRLVASYGHFQYSSAGFTLKGLPAGTYKGTIQAVDAGFLGSDFLNEISFTIYDLSGVGINVVESKITNTNNYLKYSLNSTDGVNGTWNFCSDNTTNVNFPGGIDVWVRQTDNPNNKRKIASIPAVADAPSPAYTINYIAETTSENIPATIEAYAHSSMTGIALIGEGKPLKVTPGASLYFRYRGTATTLPSKVQTLVVPARPAKPTVTLSYTTERTVQAIPASMEYDPLYDMPNPTSGTGATVQVAPSQTMYFRYKATANSFKSDNSYVYAPDRPWSPEFNIDYFNESTAQDVTSEHEYSAREDMTDAITGNGQKIPLIPGQKLYIRKKATNTVYCSPNRTLDAPARPAAPENLVVNDEMNTCNWNLDINYLLISDYDYSVDGGTNWANCPSKPLNISNINLAAGALKIRIKATAKNFKGHEAATSSAFTISTPSGVFSLEDGYIKMFPNPVIDILYLENLPENSTVYIFNLNGKLLMQKSIEEEKMKISVSELPQGLYVIKIKTSQEEYQSKFTKQ